MPGPVSDSYDPEFGTGENAHEIRQCLAGVYKKVSGILSDKPPINIVKLAFEPGMRETIVARLSEKEWRLVRFALERAQESI